MNLAQARTELQARGFDYVTASRLTDFLNNAQHEFNEYASWPWLETTATGSSPLLVPDLRDVLFVTDTTNKQELQNQDVRDITDLDPSSSATGQPLYYWLDNETVNVWPAAATVQLQVRYLKVPTDLSADGDTPVFPSRYHSDIWVTLAQARLLLLDSSNDSLAAQVMQVVTAQMEAAKGLILNRLYDHPTEQVMTQDSDSSIWRGSTW